MATSHLVCLFCVTAGQNGENLGSDEEQIVLFVYLLYDVANNKVNQSKCNQLLKRNDSVQSATWRTDRANNVITMVTQ
jgi:hypothetical protein